MEKGKDDDGGGEVVNTVSVMNECSSQAVLHTHTVICIICSPEWEDNNHFSEYRVRKIKAEYLVCRRL